MKVEPYKHIKLRKCVLSTGRQFHSAQILLYVQLIWVCSVIRPHAFYSRLKLQQIVIEIVVVDNWNSTLTYFTQQLFKLGVGIGLNVNYILASTKKLTETGNNFTIPTSKIHKEISIDLLKRWNIVLFRCVHGSQDQLTELTP